MKKEIKRLTIEIIFLTVLIATIIPMFTSLSEKRLKATEGMLANSSELTITGSLSDNGSLIPMSDNYAIKNLKESKLTIENVTNDKKNYNLMLRIDKSSTISHDYFKIRVNDKITYLTDNYKYEDDSYYYYVIFNSNIQKEEEIYFLIWLKEELTTLKGGSISYSFIVEENNKLVYK